MRDSNHLLKTFQTSSNKNVITFDGLDDFIRSNYYNYGDNISLFFVVKYEESTRQGLFDSSPGQQYTLRNTGYSGGVKAPNTFEWWPNDPILSIDCLVGEYELVNFVFFRNPYRNIAKYVNGSSFNNASSGNTQNASWTNLTLGAINSGEIPFKGSIAEVIFMYTPVADPERQKIEGYLAWKWGINSKLPSSHPYKTKAPTQ